jgi:hypothetical protein
VEAVSPADPQSKREKGEERGCCCFLPTEKIIMARMISQLWLLLPTLFLQSLLCNGWGAMRHNAAAVKAAKNTNLQPILASNSEPERNAHSLLHPSFDRRELLLRSSHFMQLLTLVVGPSTSTFGVPSLAEAAENTSPASTTEEEDDPFAAFGKQLQNESFQPTPTATMVSPSSSSSESSSTNSDDNNTNNSNLEQALKAAKARKRVDPRTHG